MNNEPVFRVESDDSEVLQVVLSPECNGVFKDQLGSLMQKYDLFCESFKLDGDSLIMAKVFLSDYVNQRHELESCEFFISRLNSCALSVVEQPPLNGYKINILLSFAKDRSIKKYVKDGVFYAHIGEELHIFQSIRDVQKFDSLEENTKYLFEIHDIVLSKSGMSISENCLRTWLYVRDVDNEYMEVVEGRNDFFSGIGLTKDSHFITSTGIEGAAWNSKSPLNIDFYSIKGVNAHTVKYLNAFNYLNPTHEYGVSFERGVNYSIGNWDYTLISGTASINNKGEILYEGDVISQLERVFLNIEQLLRDTDVPNVSLSHLIVYVRDISDYVSVDEYIINNYPNIPYVIVYAKVCRPGWLVEIECMAIRKAN